MRRYLYCAETEQGVYYGALKAKDAPQAERLLRAFLTNCGHKAIAQVMLTQEEGRDEIQVCVFDLFAEEDK